MKNFIFLNLIFLSISLYSMEIKNISEQKEVLESTNKLYNLIETTLKVELPTADDIFLEEALEIRQKAFSQIEKANYEKALEIIIKGTEKFPNNFILQAMLATLIGDCSNFFSDPIKYNLEQKSKEIFNKLINEVDNQPKKAYYSFMNEYYYRFEKYKEQYEFGLKRVEENFDTKNWDSLGIDGYYNQGAGATYYAKKLLIEGKKELALDYAQKALVSWAQFFSYDNTYYNSYVHYALALGILGHKEEMNKALKRSANLINKDLDYFEFKEVIDFINNNKL